MQDNIKYKEKTGKNIIDELDMLNHRMEAALRESETKYRRVVDNANEAILVVQDGVLRFSNPKALEFFGFTAEELKNKPFLDLIHPDDREMVIEHQNKIFKRECLEDIFSFKILNKDGQEKWVEIKSVPDLWEARPAMLNFLTDITLLKENEEEHKMLEAQLLHSRKMEAIGSLAGGIAHDFNNILGAIHGYTELAVNELEKGNQVRVNLEYVLSAAGRAKELVRQILAFSRKADEEKKIIYISHIVDEAMRLLRSSLPATIELRSRIEKELNPVMADPTRMHQVIMNLCANAGYAMRENGGLLEISLDEIELDADLIGTKELEPGRYQRLLIHDNGHGMDAETQKKIFEPYFTTKKQGEGTGMGLSLVHGIVKSHNGEIIVESEPGKGTSFYIYLPVTDINEVPEVKPSEPIKGGNERILLVDDEWTLVEMGKQMLERFGYAVDIKTSSAGALEVFSTNPNAYDLIITDQTMPVMTGIQLTQELRQIRPEIPVILCTGFSEVIDEENFKSRDIDAFIMKPIVMREIAAVIRQVLDKKHCG